MIQGKLINLLLVEDNPGDASLTQQLLINQGETLYRVMVTDRLSEAQKQLSAGGYDLILLDLNIVDSRGLATLEGIQAVAQDIPVIVLTGQADIQLVQTTLSRGVQDYLVKGEFDSSTLRRAVAYAIERKQAEIIVREGEALFRTAFEGAAVGIALIDQEGRWIQTNRAVQEMLEYSADEFSQMTFAQFTHPDDRERSLQAFQELIEGKRSRYQLEMRYVHKDESITWGRVVASIMRATETKPPIIVAMIEDITQRKEAEEALTAERNLLRTLTDHLPDRIYVKDTEGRYILKNQAAIQQMGAVSLEEVIGKTDFDYYPPELAERYFADDQTVVRSGQALVNREEPVVDADGNSGWILTTKVPLRDAHGNITGLVGIGRDVTERKHIEEAEREQRAFAEALRDTAAAINSTLNFDEVLDHILDNIWRVVPYGTANISLVEGDTVRIVRCRGRSDPTVEASIKVVAWSIQTMPHLRRLAETRRAYAIPDVASYPGWDSQMGVPWLKSWVAAPICLDSTMIGLISLDSDKEGFFNDTHAERLQAFANQAATALENARLYSEIQKHAAELQQRVEQRTAELNRARDRVEAILNSSTDAIVLAHADGKIRQANLAFDRLFNYHEDEAFGLPLTALFDATCFETVATLLQDAATDEQIRRFEAVACRKDGSVFDVEVGLSSVRMDDSCGGAVVCNVRDITERKRAEQALREALEKEKELSDLKSRFISIASHEFRTPLAIILSAVEVIKNYRHRMNDSQIEGRLDKVEDQIGHLTTLLDDVLTVSRVQTSEVEFDPTSLDLDSLCRSWVEELRHATGTTHILEFNSNCENGEPLFIDEKLFRLIVTNLISNAIKYSPSGSVVQLDLCQEPSKVTLRVADQGIGISEEDRRHLFQPFYRAANVGAIPGTGLGLTIVKHAVELHGGVIDIDSQVGGGSTFTVSIPINRSGG